LFEKNFIHIFYFQQKDLIHDQLVYSFDQTMLIDALQLFHVVKSPLINRFENMSKDGNLFASQRLSRRWHLFAISAGRKSSVTVKWKETLSTRIALISLILELSSQTKK
jgi:hypothetical protein